MKSRLGCRLSVVGCGLLLVGIAHADRVTLKSGSFLTGTVVEAKNGELKFKSDDLGELSIKIENIAELVNAGTHNILFNDGTLASNTLAVADGKYLADDKPLDMTTVKEIDPTPETWHGSVHVAYQAAQGNTFENSASVMAHVDRRWEKDRLNGDFGYYYSQTGTGKGDRQKTTDRWEVELKHDHFWWQKVYHFEDLRYDRDMIQLLRARYRAGLGGGYQWLEKADFAATGKWSFNQELGVNWIKEDYEDNPDSKEYGYCALRYAHHLSWLPKWLEGSEVFHNFEILPEVDEWEKFLSKLDLGCSTRIFLSLNLLAKIEWDYDAKPAQDRKNSDFRFVLGVGYKW